MRAWSSAISARVWTIKWVTAAALFSASGLAQVDPDELARRHFESAAAYFEQAEYEEALAAFEKAYELSNRPQILRNISIVQERLGNLDGAVTALDQYLEKAVDDPAVATMRIRRDNLKERLEKQREDEAKRKQAEAAASLRTREETEAAARTNKPRRESVGLPPESHYPDSGGADLGPAYILLSVGGLAGAGALLTGIVANIEHGKLETRCVTTCSDGQLETAQNLATASTVLTGVSIVGVGAGLIWWLTADSGTEEQVTTPRLNVKVTQASGFAEARFHF